jgi:hypothetical protein
MLKPLVLLRELLMPPPARPLDPLHRMTPRELADLPPHHPRPAGR